MGRKLELVRIGIPLFFSFYWRVFRGKKIGFSFNLADRCPLNCNCYWRAMGRTRELSDEQVRDFFRQKREEGHLLAAILGGEPYLRPKLLEQVVKIMPLNWVITSGTCPLRELDNSIQFISVDGDETTHDILRGRIGLHSSLVRNVENFRKKGGQTPLFVHTVLNQYNFTQIEPIVNFWQESGLVKGIVFSTLTRIAGVNDRHLSLSEDQQITAVNGLVLAKMFYGEFICMTQDAILNLLPLVTSGQTRENCPTSKLVTSFDASGVEIEKCIFSDRGICEECGCAITGILKTLLDFHSFFKITKVMMNLTPIK